MRRNLGILTKAAALFGAFLFGADGAAAERFEAEDIRLEDVTGSVAITTHSGDEIDVTLRQGNVYRRVDVSLENGVVVLRGERWKEEDRHDCCDDRITRTFEPRHGREAKSGEAKDESFFNDYPVIEIAMPRRGDVTFLDARVKLEMDDIEGALNLDACYAWGEAGDAGSAVIGLIHGSRLVMGDIGSGLEVDLSGDADFRAGSAASVDVDIAGPGDAVIGEIDGMLDVSIAGSGIVRVARLEGPMMTRIAGSGGVAVQGGRADRLKAVIDGSGMILFEGLAVQPELRLYGSAEVRMNAVRGRIERHGGGEVYVDGKLVSKDQR